MKIEDVWKGDITHEWNEQTKRGFITPEASFYGRVKSEGTWHRATPKNSLKVRMSIIFSEWFLNLDLPTYYHRFSNFWMNKILLLWNWFLFLNFKYSNRRNASATMDGHFPIVLNVFPLDGEVIVIESTANHGHLFPLFPICLRYGTHYVIQCISSWIFS